GRDWSDVPHDVRKEWLEENGFDDERGRHPHDMCPINPTRDEGKHRDPVIVGDIGIFCYYCAGCGGAYDGCRTPGFVPFRRLVDPDKVVKSRNPLREAVHGWCHWAHAKYVVETETHLTGPRAERLYRALIKAVHLRKLPEKDPRREEKLKLIDNNFLPQIPML